MSVRLNPIWMESQRDLISKCRPSEGKHYEIVCTDNRASKFVIATLSSGYAFKVINLGAGVKKITTRTDTCPKCGGTGKC